MTPMCMCVCVCMCVHACACFIQFRHVKSGRWLTARPRKVSTVRKDHIIVELDDLGNHHSVFLLHPRYKHRQCVRPVQGAVRVLSLALACSTCLVN